MSDTNGMTTAKVEVEVRPLRFTAHLAQLREFLSLLGFSARVTKGELWATMVGESGQVALHDVAISAAGGRSGETGLWFEAGDADALAAQLARAGFGDVMIEDEAWGRVLLVRGDGGAQLGFDERQTDFYGSQVDEPEPRHGITAVAVVHDVPEGPIDRLLVAAGLTRLDEGDWGDGDDGGDGEWRVYRGRGNGGGLVALSAAGPSDGAAGTEQLAFRTREPLTDLAGRLEAAGHPVVARPDGALVVTDPDGRAVVVRPESA